MMNCVCLYLNKEEVPGDSYIKAPLPHHKVHIFPMYPVCQDHLSEVVNDWSLITGRGGLQNGKSVGPKLSAPPPPQDRVKLFAPPPPSERVETFCSHPSIWLKLQANT